MNNAPSLGMPGPNHRMLVIDDNAAIHADFRKILAGAPSSDQFHAATEEFLFGVPSASSCLIPYEIDTASQGREGLALVEEACAAGRPYALAFVDVRMPPGWDGLETLERIWAVDPELQAVLCTAYSDYSWEELTRRLGRSDRLLILKKPFDNVEVLQFAATLTEKWRLGRAAHRERAGLNELVAARTADLRAATKTLETAHCDLLAEVEERRQAESRIREQAALLDKTRDAIIVCDLDCRIQSWNRGAEALYGWPEAVALGQELAGVLHSGEPAGENFLAAAETTLAAGSWSGEQGHQRHNGSKVQVESRWTLLRNDDGAPTSILLVNTDVTERKQLEQRVLRSQRLESIGALASGIAHDLNNVLTPVLMTEQLIRRVAPESALPLLDLLQSSAKRGASLVRQVLTFARGAEGERTVLSIPLVLKELESLVRDTFPRSIEFMTDFEKSLHPILGNGTQLHQVIMNLCVNARDAMSDGGTLTLSAQNFHVDPAFLRVHPEATAGDYVLITVADSGAGMTPEIIDRIFEPFFTTKPVGKGTGLGLSTALGLVKSHGGLLEVDSDPGRGTRMQVFLPADLQDRPAAPASDPASVPAGHGEKILLVDDETAVREATRLTLAHHGYDVEVASSGAEAIGLCTADSGRFRLLITDTMMPGMDGPTTVRAIHRINPRLPVIAVSGLARDPGYDNTSGVSQVSFLHKPYSADTLLFTVRRVLDTLLELR